MYIDRREVREYPFRGVFYFNTTDETLPLDEREETEHIIIDTECDITEASHSRVGDFIKAVYSIYVPFDKRIEDAININRGMMFRSNQYGVRIDGKVEGVFPSQLGGYVCYVQANDV